MGAWDATIMGNDSTADGQAALFRHLGIRDDMSNHEIRQALNSITPELWHEYVSEGNFEPYSNDKRIAGAFVIMQYGATLPAQIARQALSVAYHEEDENRLSSWRNPEERRHYVQSFIQSLIEYDGTPPVFHEYTGQTESASRRKPSGV